MNGKKHTRKLMAAGMVLGAAMAAGVPAFAAEAPGADGDRPPCAHKAGDRGPRAERMGMRGEHHGPPRFSDMDANHDSKLSMDEAKDTPFVRDFGFDKLDANGDGFLTIGEIPEPPAHGEGRGPGGPGRFEGGGRLGDGPPHGRPPAFEELDANRDGKLSPEEAAEIPPVRDMGFKSLDENNDGYLSKAELPPPPDFEDGPPSHGEGDRGTGMWHDRGGSGPDTGPGHGREYGPGRGAGHRPPRFEDHDTNGDGKLSRDEAKEIPPVRDRGFDAWDENKDGFLSKEELPPPPHGGRGMRGPGERGRVAPAHYLSNIHGPRVEAGPRPERPEGGQG